MVEVVETKGFTASADDYLSEIEFDALRHLLAAKPWIGEPDSDAPGLLDLRWREQLHVVYTVDRRENESRMDLVAVYFEDEDVAPSVAQREALRAKLDWLKKIGVGIGLKELIEWLKGMF